MLPIQPFLLVEQRAEPTRMQDDIDHTQLREGLHDEWPHRWSTRGGIHLQCLYIHEAKVNIPTMFDMDKLGSAKCDGLVLRVRELRSRIRSGRLPCQWNPYRVLGPEP